MTIDLTPKSACYTAHEEGFVAEAYLDGGGIWTAFLGVTNASGHQVYPRYLDNPQPLEKGVAISLWLMRERYLPAVENAFAGFALNEAQLAAALSFHWNTGAIGVTTWVKQVLRGEMDAARRFLETHYLNSGMLTPRREREAALFFDGEWPSDMRVPVFPVNRSTHHPITTQGRLVDMIPLFGEALAA